MRAIKARPEFANNKVLVSNPEPIGKDETYKLNTVIGPNNDNSLKATMSAMMR